MSIPYRAENVEAAIRALAPDLYPASQPLLQPGVSEQDQTIALLALLRLVVDQVHMTAGQQNAESAGQAWRTLVTGGTDSPADPRSVFGMLGYRALHLAFDLEQIGDTLDAAGRGVIPVPMSELVGAAKKATGVLLGAQQRIPEPPSASRASGRPVSLATSGRPGGRNGSAMVAKWTQWTIPGKSYPGQLPLDLVDWYCYVDGAGHSLLVADEKAWHKTPKDPGWFAIPASVKTVLRLGYRWEDGWPVVSGLDIDPEVGLRTPEDECEF
ncbi:hypothetical protein [Kitasatospora kifunensis]|uniref:Uncharacterized protein n=1 Tax=Kitasatospora kifunensis TaxID=58351 RepID=A0A7W7W0V5_KITKI|nr:hypothetical protein [Kitasatospora kifunensis]MBB4929099.1 hypothetical protein [Kitasatospora kifunensis]